MSSVTIATKPELHMNKLICEICLKTKMLKDLYLERNTYHITEYDYRYIYILINYMYNLIINCNCKINFNGLLLLLI